MTGEAQRPEVSPKSPGSPAESALHWSGVATRGHCERPESVLASQFGPAVELHFKTLGSFQFSKCAF